MKIKILLFPLLLLIIIGTLIWFIVPTWKEIQTQGTLLQEKNKILTQLQNENQKVDGLAGALQKVGDDKNLVYSYVPPVIGDEDIINNLVYYAGQQSGDDAVQVSKISIAQPEKKTASNVSAGASMPNIGMIPNQGIPEGALPVAIPAVPPAQPSFFNVKFEISGKYSGIKKFLATLETFKRSHSLVGVNISNGGQTGAASSTLTADVDLTFNYVEKYNPIGNIDSNSLGESLNSAVVQEIKNKMSSDVVPVQIGNQPGRDNPFLP